MSDYEHLIYEQRGPVVTKYAPDVAFRAVLVAAVVAERRVKPAEVGLHRGADRQSSHLLLEPAALAEPHFRNVFVELPGDLDQHLHQERHRAASITPGWQSRRALGGVSWLWSTRRRLPNSARRRSESRKWGLCTDFGDFSYIAPTLGRRQLSFFPK
jgi:hypothetical protein